MNKFKIGEKVRIIYKNVLDAKEIDITHTLLGYTGVVVATGAGICKVQLDNPQIAPNSIIFYEWSLETIEDNSVTTY